MEHRTVDLRRALWLSVFFWCFYVSWPWTLLERVDVLPEGKSRVSVLLRNGVGSAPATIHAVIKIDISPENRILRAELDSADFTRASEWDLVERFADQRTFDWWISDIPCGEYELRVTLAYYHDLKVERAVDSRPLRVLGIGCDVGDR